MKPDPDFISKDWWKGCFTPIVGTWTFEYSSCCSSRATDVRSSCRATGPEEEGYIAIDRTSECYSANQFPSPTSGTRVYNRLRGRVRRHISPLVETIPELPSEPPSQRWQNLGKEMGEITMVTGQRERTLGHSGAYPLSRGRISGSLHRQE